MKKLEVLWSLIKNSILFSPGYCLNLRAPLIPVLTMLKLETEMIFSTNKQDLLSSPILGRDLRENIDDYLKTPKKYQKKEN